MVAISCIIYLLIKLMIIIIKKIKSLLNKIISKLDKKPKSSEIKPKKDTIIEPPCKEENIVYYKPANPGTCCEDEDNLSDLECNIKGYRLVQCKKCGKKSIKL